MQLQRQGALAVLSMNAGKANAIGPAWLDHVDRLWAELDASDAAAVVLVGYDRYFCAGLDLPSLSPLTRADMEGFMRRFQQTMVRIFAWPRPVVAAINGHAVAGGCVLALQADYRLMADGPYRIGLNEVQLGLGLPAVVTETLRCQVPAASLGPVALEGRLLMPAEALQLGLVDQVVAPEALLGQATDLAIRLGDLSRVAYGQIKLGLRRPVQQTILGTDDVASWMETWESPDTKARIAAAMARIGQRPSN